LRTVLTLEALAKMGLLRWRSPGAIIGRTVFRASQSLRRLKTAKGNLNSRSREG
jgi:hypothetical protein